MIPDDLAERWTMTETSLRCNEWALFISFATYPPPRCFDQARLYETKRAEIAEMQQSKRIARATKSKQGKRKKLELKQEEFDL